MKLLSPAEFSLRLRSAYSDRALPRSEVIVAGTPTGKVLTGAILEAAIEWNGFSLAFLTDDIPQEDTLRIYLFDSRLALRDSATLGAMYSTGSFTGLELLPPNTVQFRFIGNKTWILQLLPQDSFALPFFSDPEGVRRPLKLHRRFRLYGEPLPDSGS